MATGRMVSWASCGALAVWLLAGCGGSVAPAPKPASAPPAKPVEITDVQFSGTGEAVQITVIRSAKAAYSLVRQSNPPRLSLQLTGARLAGQEKRFLSSGCGDGCQNICLGVERRCRGVYYREEPTTRSSGQEYDVVLNVTAGLPKRRSGSRRPPVAGTAVRLPRRLSPPLPSSRPPPSRPWPNSGAGAKAGSPLRPARAQVRST